MKDTLTASSLDCPLVAAGLADIDYTEFSDNHQQAFPISHPQRNPAVLGSLDGRTPLAKVDGAEDSTNVDDIDIDLVEEEIFSGADFAVADTVDKIPESSHPYTLRLLPSHNIPPYPRATPPWSALSHLLANPGSPTLEEYPSYTFSRFIDWQLAEPPCAQAPLSHPDTISAWPVIARHIPFFRRITEVDVGTEDGWKIALTLKRCMRGKNKDDWVPPFLYQSILSCQGCRDDDHPCLHSTTGPPLPSLLPEIYLPIQCLPCIQAERVCQYVLPSASATGCGPFRQTAILAKVDPESIPPAIELEEGIIIPAPSQRDIPPHLRRLDDQPKPDEETEPSEVCNSILGPGWSRIRPQWRVRPDGAVKNNKGRKEEQVKRELGSQPQKQLPGVTMLRLTLGRKAVTEHQRRLELTSEKTRGLRYGRLLWTDRTTREERISARRSSPPLAPRAMLSISAAPRSHLKRERSEVRQSEDSENIEPRLWLDDSLCHQQRPLKRPRLEEPPTLTRRPIDEDVQSIIGPRGASIHRDRLALKRKRSYEDFDNDAPVVEKKGQERTGANTSELTVNRWGVKTSDLMLTASPSSDRRSKRHRVAPVSPAELRMDISAEARVNTVSPGCGLALDVPKEDRSPRIIQSVMDDISSRIEPARMGTTPNFQVKGASLGKSDEIQTEERREKDLLVSTRGSEIVCRGRGEKKALRSENTWWEDVEVSKDIGSLMADGDGKEFPAGRGKRKRARRQLDEDTTPALTIHLGMQPSHPIPDRPPEISKTTLPSPPIPTPVQRASSEVGTTIKVDRSRTKEEMSRAAAWKLMLVKKGLNP